MLVMSQNTLATIVRRRPLMFKEVHLEELVGIGVVLIMALACWVMPIIQRSEYQLKMKINSRLAKHGLRLKERV